MPSPNRSLILVDVYEKDNAAVYLYMLLNERPDYANISHKKMPAYDDHSAFFATRPYEGWWLIIDLAVEKFEGIIGSIYVTDRKEVGIAIFKEYQRKGYANQALAMLRGVFYPDGTLYANIAPGNEASIKLFERNGYKHIQNTYASEPDPPPEPMAVPHDNKGK